MPRKTKAAREAEIGRMIVTKEDPKKELVTKLASVKEQLKAKQEEYNKIDQDLRNRKIEAENIEKELAQLRDQAFLNALTPELVDALAPEHDRTSCSDDNRCNAERGCTRCALLEAKNMSYIDFKWSFEIRSRFG